MSAAVAAPAASAASAGAGPGDDVRALVGAWAISAGLGMAWVALVLFGPQGRPTLTLRPTVEPTRVVVTLAPEPVASPAPAVPQRAAPEPPAPLRSVQPTRSAAAAAAAPPVASRVPARASEPRPADLGAAFGGAAFGGDAGAAAPVGDVRGVLGGVRVRGAGEDARASSAGRAVLATSDGTGDRTPGRAPGSSAAGAAIGAVARGGGVSRAEVRVLEPRAEGAGAPSASGGTGAGSARLGGEARRRESELRVCYAENGLRADPALAGRVTLAITVGAGGAVSGVAVKNRSWAGPGADAAEQCILGRVRAWRLGAAAGEGRYELSFSFTR